MYIYDCFILILMELTRRDFLKAGAAAVLLLNSNEVYASEQDSTSRYFYSGRDARPDLGLIPATRKNLSSISGQSSLEDILKIGTNTFFHPQTGAAEIRKIGEDYLMLVPWYSSSSDRIFKKFDRVTNPSPSNYAMVSDEQSELVWLVFVGNDPERMRAACKTIEAMQGKYGTLPGWVAEVKDGRISLISQDSASDASARFIQSLLQAAKNLNFSQEDRVKYKQKGIQMAYDSIEFEYARGSFRSELTGRHMDMIGAGGGKPAGTGEKV